MFMFFCTGIGIAQDRDNTADLRDFYMDFSVTEVTAFSMLNTEPNSVVRPGTIKEFAGSLGSYVTKDGTIKPGLALEWAPIRTFCRKIDYSNKALPQLRNLTFSAATIDDTTTADNVLLATAFRYTPIDKRNPLATDHGVGQLNSLIDKYLFGLKDDQRKLDSIYAILDPYFIDITLRLKDQLEGNSQQDTLRNQFKAIFNFDDTYIFREFYSNNFKDPVTASSLKNVEDVIFGLLNESELTKLGYIDVESDSVKRLTQLTAEYFVTKLPQIVNFSEEDEKGLEDLILNFKAQYKKDNWNKMALEFGAGSIFNVPGGKMRSINQNYSTAYVSFGMPLAREKANPDCKKLHNWFRNKSQLIFVSKYQFYMNPDSLEMNSFFAGARFLMGDYDKRFSAEIGYRNQTDFTGLNQAGWQYSVGGDFRISDGNWLEVAIGGQVINGNGTINLLPRFAYRHAFNSESRFFKK